MFSIYLVVNHHFCFSNAYYQIPYFTVTVTCKISQFVPVGSLQILKRGLCRRQIGGTQSIVSYLKTVFRILIFSEILQEFIEKSGA